MPASAAVRLDQRRARPRVGDRLAIVVVAVPARAGLLAEPAHLAEAVRDERPARAGVAELAQLLPHAPRDVEAGHVVHGEDAHRHAEVGERAIDLLRRRAFLDQELRLVHVGEHHAVADEARAVADHHADLAEPLGQRQRRGHGLGRGGSPADDLDQPHDVGRAEEVQADDGLGPRVAPAIASMSSVEVLVASRQLGPGDLRRWRRRSPS